MRLFPLVWLSLLVASPASAQSSTGAEGAYFTLEDGLARLAPNGELTRFPRVERRPRSLAMHNGSVVAIHGAPSRLGRHGFVELSEEQEAFPDGLLVASDGALWGWNDEGIGRFDGSDFRLASHGVSRAQFITEALLDEDDVPWLVVSNDRGDPRVLRQRGRSFRRVRVPGDDEVASLYRDHEGRVVLQDLDHFWRRGRRWERLDTDWPHAPGRETPYARTATFGRDGRIILSNRVVVWTVLPDGTRHIAPEGTTELDNIIDVAVDADLRTWVVSTRGVMVLGPDLRRLAWWPTGSFPALGAGVVEVVAFGAAPPLPTPTTEALAAATRDMTRRASFVGTVTRERAPVAGVQLELCERPRTRNTPREGHPCGEHGLRAQSDAAGRFRIENVPLLRGYTAAVLTDEGWKRSGPSSICISRIRPGATCEIEVRLDYVY